MAIGDRLRRSWNVFLNKDPTEFVGNTGAGYREIQIDLDLVVVMVNL